MIPLPMSVSDLRLALGMPLHALMAEGIFATTPAPVVLSGENVKDTDHSPENALRE